MFAMMQLIWPRIGEQNTRIRSHRVDPVAYDQVVVDFTEAHKVDELVGVPVVEPPPGDIYLQAKRYQFRPILRLKRGESYQLHISSLDVQVGKYELECGTVNKNGYCHKMAGKRPFPQEEINVSWTDADGKQHKQEVNVTVPVTMNPGQTLRFELEIHSDGSAKWGFGQEGSRR